MTAKAPDLFADFTREQLLGAMTAATRRSDELRDALAAEKAARAKAEAGWVRDAAALNVAYSECDKEKAARQEAEAELATVGERLGKIRVKMCEEYEQMIAAVETERDAEKAAREALQREWDEKTTRTCANLATQLNTARSREAVLVGALKLWATLYREGYTQKVCDRVGLGIEHVRGGAPGVQREVLRRIDAALSSSPVDGAAREAEQAVVEAAEKYRDAWERRYESLPDNETVGLDNAADAKADLFDAVDRLCAAREPVTARRGGKDC